MRHVSATLYSGYLIEIYQISTSKSKDNAFYIFSICADVCPRHYRIKINLMSVLFHRQLIFNYDTAAKLLQKSEIRKDIVIELSYRGFSRASDYS